MRTHKLAKLPEILGAEKILSIEGDFDFYHAKKVRKIFWENLEEPDLSNLTLTLEYQGKGVYEVVIKFHGIKELQLPPIRDAVELVELEVEDLKGCGLEGIRYEIVSHFDRSFKCSCQSLQIIEFKPI